MKSDQAKSEAWWRDRKNPEIATYRNSVSTLPRRFLADAAAAMRPWGSVLEFGCHCGPNLTVLRDRFGQFAYTGIDVNPAAIGAAREEFKNDPRSAFRIGNATALDYLDESFDLVFTSSCLSLIAPDVVGGVIEKLIAMAREAVIFQEPQRTGDGHARILEWAHDYGTLIQAACARLGLRPVVGVQGEMESQIWTIIKREIGITHPPGTRRLAGSGAMPYGAPPATDTFTEPPLTTNKIAIVGFYEKDWPLVPWDDPLIEKWVMNMAPLSVPTWHRCFEPHNRVDLEIETEQMKRAPNASKRFLDTLQAERQRPIYMVGTPEQWTDIPCMVPIPYERVRTYFGEHCDRLLEKPWVESAMGWQMAVAIMMLCDQGAPVPGAEIQIYGCPLAQDTEYAYQRENATFFAAFAMGRGIKVTFTENATWCEGSGAPYGFAIPHSIELVSAMRGHLTSDVLPRFEAQVSAADARMRRAQFEWHEYRGALEQIKWQIQYYDRILRGGPVSDLAAAIPEGSSRATR